MRRIGKNPKLLPNVMDAIACLKERYGSTKKRITDYVANDLIKNGSVLKNVPLYVLKALEHGHHAGLIKLKQGKYSLGLSKDVYGGYWKLAQNGEPTDCGPCRRGYRRGSSRKSIRKRRKKRKRQNHKAKYSRRQGTDTERSESEISIPIDKSKRRKRRRSKKPRRKPRRKVLPKNQDGYSTDSASNRKILTPATSPDKNQTHKEANNSHQSNNTNTTNNTNNNNNNTHLERNRPSDIDREQEDEVECGNPECLCSIRSDDHSPSNYMSRGDLY
ncbi:hypothetical protein ABEB36_002339 [Hypothenemus hampei]|uniref:H15 domain-containing protein n=1 Tax=Hypothenemus hampei TaxID=57062 RepID=A0ABD1F5D5_HYPHA